MNDLPAFAADIPDEAALAKDFDSVGVPNSVLGVAN
jgi:hypothetical protein